MSSTVTTTTVASVTLLGSLGFILILVLLLFVIKKEIASSSENPRAQTLSRVLNMVILPLMIAFILIASGQLITIFG